MPRVLGASHDRLVSCCLTYLRRDIDKHFKQYEASEEYLRTDPVSDSDRDCPFLRCASTCLLHHLERAHAGGVPQHKHAQELGRSPLLDDWKSFHDLFAWERNDGIEAGIPYILSFDSDQAFV